MSTTDTIPTPAADLAELTEVDLRTRRAEIEDAARAEWAGAKAADVIAHARTLYPHARTSKTNTKDIALNLIARKAWEMSPEHERIAALRRDAQMEAFAIEAMEAAPRRAELARGDVVADLTQPGRVRYEAVLDLVAAARKAQVTADMWNAVRSRIDQGAAPLDALAAVRDRVRQELLAPWLHDPLSRSTAITRNLDQDLEASAKAEWLAGQAWL